jgi:toluene monooxygenase system ferredoxin subunit
MSSAATINFVELCAADDLWMGEMETFDLGSYEVLLINIDGVFHAYDAACPHQSVPLIEGRLDGKVLTCRAHRWSFDACSGASINPSGKCLRRFALRIVSGKVWVADQAFAE